MADPAAQGGVFARAELALTLLAVDPAGLGGIVLRARAGPVRAAVLPALDRVALPQRRLHPAMGDDALFGGLDLSATLSSGHLVTARGLLDGAAVLVLTSAERAAPQLAARLAAALDAGSGHCLIALDEGAEEDEICPPALAERCAFFADLADVPLADATLADAPELAADLAAARARLADIGLPDDLFAQIAATCDGFGVDSPRAALFTLRAARAHAALRGADAVTGDDLAAALSLVLPQRATRVPETAEEAPEDETPKEAPENPDDDRPDDQDDTPDEGDLDRMPTEMLLEAVRALLPEDLLARLAARKARAGKGSGTGAARKGNRRGRPLPARPGKPGSGARIDLVATLRSAAPWQTIRARVAPDRTGLHIRPDDIRLKRFEERSDRLLIFAVDASGSAALARLGEAKGAIEILLAQAYARRDHVALIAFRGTGAEVLLPPTRSLVQTKRRLADLPGGGGTPLAAGLQAAHAQADLARRKGLTPTLALLTDGRANIALDGRANRAQAGEDARRAGTALRAAGIDALVIDTGIRPEPDLKTLAAALGGTYLPLPRADAERLSRGVAAALDG